MQTNKSQNLPIILFLALLLPALLINLGTLPIRTDEPTRGLVAFEMLKSGNYIVPTIAGEFYYNKPPLYNWMLLGLMKITGSSSVWVIRIPMILSLLGFSLTIFYHFKKLFNRDLAFLAAAGLIVSARILFYDSMLGLIDITFSWITFVGFMIVYNYHKRGNYWRLFLLTYLITAAGFLMKGLPSLVFQAGTLLAFFIYVKDFKRLFSIQHVAGIVLFFTLVGSYFYFYSEHNSLITYFNTLWTESSQRTPLEKSILSSVFHFLYFPLEFIGHFAPISLLVVACIKKGFWRELMGHRFLKFSFIMLVVNIFVYWISPDTRPRYLFMLVPFLLVIGLYFYQTLKKEAVQRKVLNVLFVSSGIMIALLTLVPVFWEKTEDVPNVVLFSILGFVLVSTVVFLCLKNKTRILYFIPAILLAGRIEHNLIAQPEQKMHSRYANYMESAKDIVKITEGKPLKLYLWTPLNQDLIYAISTGRDEILDHEWLEIRKGIYYIIPTDCLLDADFEVFYNFKTLYQDTQLHVVKLRD